jgi:hypothetical protein
MNIIKHIFSTYFDTYYSHSEKQGGKQASIQYATSAHHWAVHDSNAIINYSIFQVTRFLKNQVSSSTSLKLQTEAI